MSAEARIGIRRVLVGIPSTAQDGGDLDSTLQTLLSKREPFELVEAVTIGSAVDGCVAENDIAHAGVEDCGIGASATADFWAFQLALETPGIAALVVHKARVVVTFVEILEDTGKDFGVFVGQKDASVVALEELIATGRCKEGRVDQHVFVSGKQSLFLSHHNSDDGASESWTLNWRATVQTVLHLLLDFIAERPLGRLGQLGDTVL